MSSKKGKASSVSIGLNIDGEVCFDKGVVGEKFNSFYTTVASKLVEKLPINVNKLERSLYKVFIKVKVLHQIVIHFQWFQKTKS